MTDKHTPGPWVVLNAGATVSRYGYADSAETIADVRHKPDGESAANAALIAAAPPLRLPAWLSPTWTWTGISSRSASAQKGSSAALSLASPEGRPETMTPRKPSALAS